MSIEYKQEKCACGCEEWFTPTPLTQQKYVNKEHRDRYFTKIANAKKAARRKAVADALPTYTCGGCKKEYKAKARQHEALKAGKAIWCSRRCKNKGAYWADKALKEAELANQLAMGITPPETKAAKRKRLFKEKADKIRQRQKAEKAKKILVVKTKKIVIKTVKEARKEKDVSKPRPVISAAPVNKSRSLYISKPYKPEDILNKLFYEKRLELIREIGQKYQSKQ